MHEYKENVADCPLIFDRTDVLLTLKKTREETRKSIDTTNWNLTFPNTDLAVTYIEAKARLMEADKKLVQIINSVERFNENFQKED